MARRDARPAQSPVHITNIDQLFGFTPELTLTRPIDGQQFVIKVKAPTGDDVENIRKSVGTPKRKVKNVTRNKDGSFTTEYDEEAYQEELAQASVESVYRLVAMCLIGGGLSIPGADLKEQSSSLRKLMDSWAIVQLGRELNVMAGVTQEDVDMAFQDFQLPTS